METPNLVSSEEVLVKARKVEESGVRINSIIAQVEGTNPSPTGQTIKSIEVKKYEFYRPESKDCN